MTAIRILLIEDDPADARLVGLMLRKVPDCAFTVEIAVRLSEALGRLAEGAVDVVLADLSLPDSTGLATLTALTQAAPHLPVVVLTGNDDDAQAIGAVKHGAQDYLVKGRGDGFILSRVIRYAIERKAAERALKEARDKAEAAVRAKSIFLATVGHEIRTPLNGVLGMTRLLLDTPLDQRQKAFAETVLSSGELLLGLVNDILDFSRLEADGLTLEAVAVDVIDLVEELRLMMAPRAADKGLTLGCRFAPDCPRQIEADPLRLRQVLLNLVGNAIKFTERGGVMVEVATEGEGAGTILRFTVTDSGMGIPSEARDALFTEFSQADSSITRRFGGAGLGLAICKKLVTLMGGAIGFDSNPGQGSSFWFTVPLRHAHDAPTTEEPHPHAVAVRGRILLIDDNEVNRDVASGLLERHGQIVTALDGGEGAVAALQSAEFDLVLLDMHMPGMDGIETARALRADPAGATLPIWLLTANPVEQDGKPWREAGIDGCLAKPFRVEEVLDLLARHDPADRPVPAAPGQKLINLPDLLADLKDLGRDRMRSLVDLFHRSAGKDLDAALERAAAADLEGLAPVIHRLASSSASMHLLALNERCRAIENAARAGDAKALDLAGGLRDLWDRSVKALGDVVH